MRILAICMEDPERILGGMGMHVRELYRAMSQRGDVQVDLLTMGERDHSVDYLGFEKHHGDKLVCWKPREAGLGCLMMADLQVAKTLARLLAEGRTWDLVHIHEWTSVQIGRMARDALKVPMVGTLHLCLTKLAEVENPGSMADLASWGEADRYMVQQEGNLVCDPQDLILCSRSYVRTIRDTFFTDRPIHLVYNGINISEWHPMAGDSDRARETHHLYDRLVALYAGRIATMKGVVPLLEALESEDPGWTVVLAGEVNANTEEAREGWEVTRRLRALEAAHPDRLRWLGFHHGQDLRDLYAVADAVVMPSIHEPFGIVALEAMAMGTPLLSTEVDGLGEIVCDGEGGEFALIIPSRSPGAILQVLQVMKDPEVRAKLTSLGLERVRAFSWEEAADRTVAVYRQALDRAELATAVRNKEPDHGRQSCCP